jgi:nitrite reductase/ring-hydroxylating ferredoxin subunit
VPAAQPAAQQQVVQTPSQGAGFLQPYVELAPIATPVAADTSANVFGAMTYMGAGAGVAVLGLMGFAKAKSVLAARSATPEMSGGAIPTKKVWVNFVAAKDVPPGQVASGFRYGQEIAVANDKGSLYALANKLPPTGQPATFGEIQGKGILKEPITGTLFNMKTGKPAGEWCPTLVGKLFRLLVGPSDVPTYPCRKSGNNIEVQINVNAKAQFEANYWRGVLDSQGKVDGGYY